MSGDVVKAVCKEIDSVFETEHLDWFRRLVEIPSHTGCREDVEHAAQWIDARATELGMTKTHFPDPEERFADHRIYASPATGESDTAMALVGHCDTVYPRSMEFLEFMRDPVESESQGDIVRGPGVLDMKSGLSVVVFALQAIKRAAPQVWQELKVRFLCNTDEEVGSPSSRAMFDQMAPLTSFAMVFEAGRDEDRIVTSRKGTGGFRITAHGHEAHAGNEHAAGVNAIHALSLVVPRIEALTSYDRGTTVNVGVIEGGTAKNTVPGIATALFDVRVSTIEQAHHIEAKLAEIVVNPFAGCVDVPERLNQIRFELEGGILRLPMEATDDSQRLRQAYEPFAAIQGLGIGEAPTQGGGSDANLLSACGVPTIDGLGPYGKAFHSVREWSSLESLKRRTSALACFLISDEAAELTRSLSDNRG